MQLGIPKPRLIPKTRPKVTAPKDEVAFTNNGASDEIAPAKTQMDRKRVLPPSFFVRKTPSKADAIRAAKWMLQTAMFGRKSM